MTTPPFALRLKPRADARRLRHGHPWAWSDEIVLDRRSRKIPPASLAVLEDADRQPLAVGIADVEAKIAFRVLDRDPAAVIDAGWLRARLGAALALRERLFEAPFYRLVHAEGDGLPGLIVDRFGAVLVMQPNARWLEDRLPALTDILAELTGAQVIVKNGTSRARVQEGLPEETAMLLGAAPAGPIEVSMNGATYMADVMGGQKTGLFYDQRPNHALARGNWRAGAGCSTSSAMSAAFRLPRLPAARARRLPSTVPPRRWRLRAQGRGCDGSGRAIRDSAGRCLRGDGGAGRGGGGVRSRGGRPAGLRPR